jgi:hypothetical protein
MGWEKSSREKTRERGAVFFWRRYFACVIRDTAITQRD